MATQNSRWIWQVQVRVCWKIIGISKWKISHDCTFFSIEKYFNAQQFYYCYYCIAVYIKYILSILCCCAFASWNHPFFSTIFVASIGNDPSEVRICINGWMLPGKSTSKRVLPTSPGGKKGWNAMKPVWLHVGIVEVYGFVIRCMS